uniref:20 kDa chaperonin, chloroplastic n=1 Tax=Alexandrium monilatum TaxID=311494 RepID=A0A7S4QWM9_9DINO|mmetsp:Transcript_84291/g.251202  ORF Transcript_84291/g.251202 Transcript_84291/m.251202 type:complete len:277 (+) Transcript_84291:50-880(+)
MAVPRPAATRRPRRGLGQICSLVPAVLGLAWLLRLRGQAFALGAPRGLLHPAPVRRTRSGSGTWCRASGDAIRVDGTVEPLGSYVLVKLPPQEELSAGGIVLPTRTDRPRFGEVLAVGPGEAEEKTGEARPVELQVGDQVLYGRYASPTVVECGDEEHALLRARDVLCGFGGGKAATLEGVQMPRGTALVRLAEAKEETQSGLLLSKSAAEATSTLGEVVAVGGSELLPDGKEMEPPVEVGDMVRFRFGDEVELEGDEARYSAVRFSNCVAKWRAA